MPRVPDSGYDALCKDTDSMLDLSCKSSASAFLAIAPMAANVISYLRLPALATSAIAAVASGLLYWKQKWVEK